MILEHILLAMLTLIALTILAYCIRKVKNNPGSTQRIETDSRGKQKKN